MSVKFERFITVLIVLTTIALGAALYSASKNPPNAELLIEDFVFNRSPSNDGFCSISLRGETEFGNFDQELRSSMRLVLRNSSRRIYSRTVEKKFESMGFLSRIRVSYLGFSEKESAEIANLHQSLMSSHMETKFLESLAQRCIVEAVD